MFLFSVILWRGSCKADSIEFFDVSSPFGREEMVLKLNPNAVFKLLVAIVICLIGANLIGLIC